MFRVLNMTSKMDVGGAETFLMKVFRNTNLKSVIFDFLVFSKETGFYDTEINQLGGNVYNCTPKTRNIVKSFYEIIRVVKDHKYVTVFRMAGHSLACIDLLAAQFGGAKIRVVRSTNTNFSGSYLAKILHFIFRPLLNQVATLKLAPSTEAAVWLFGKKAVKNGKVKIIKNGVELDKFLFCAEKRERLRKNLNVENNFVIGHIGRFNEQKNHEFLLDIFYRIKQIENNAVLLLIGQGELENKIRQKVKELGLEDCVQFTGVRSDIPELLMAMDVFIFPSHYEGMPNSVIEAQATGLKCLVSDQVTNELGFTDLVEFFPLSWHPAQWANKAVKYKLGYERKDMKEEFIKNGYDIKSTAKLLEDYYLSQIGGSKVSGNSG